MFCLRSIWEYPTYLCKMRHIPIICFLCTKFSNSFPQRDIPFVSHFGTNYSLRLDGTLMQDFPFLLLDCIVLYYVRLNAKQFWIANKNVRMCIVGALSELLIETLVFLARFRWKFTWRVLVDLKRLRLSRGVNWKSRSILPFLRKLMAILYSNQGMI